MREIKFRAWDEKNKEMVDYGNGDYREWCIRTDGFFGWVSKYGYIQNGDRKFILMQYTGKKDIEGYKIFEDDIWVVYSKETEGKELARIIISMDDLSKKVFDGWRAGQGEVIGNIYENPELREAQHGKAKNNQEG